MRSLDRTLTGTLGLFAAWVLVALVAAALGPALIGWSPHVVTSGSMAPVVHRGDVLLTDWVEGHHLHRGQIVLFDAGDGLTAHRIVEVLADGRYRTRGDANASADSTPVAPSQVRGVVRLAVPMIGRFVLLPNEPRSFQALVALTLILIACTARSGITSAHDRRRFA